MQNVSQNWKDNQNKQLVSEGFVEISLDLTDPDAVGDASIEHNGALSISKAEQVIDSVDEEIVKYSTLEQNLWLLDGSIRHATPDDYGYCGYIGNEMSGIGGSFTTYPLVMLQFSEVHESNIPGISITWSESYDDYATDFTITAYNGDTVVATKEVVGNTDITSNVILSMQGYDSISIEIRKWCLPYRRPRIENIILGFKKVYDKSDLFSFSHSQEVDIISASLPKSTISFSVDNTNREYDPDRADGLSRYLNDKQELKVKYGYKLGDKIEWIKGGTFYLTGRGAKENSNTADFEAQDIFKYLTVVYNKSVYVAEGKRLYDLAVDVLTFADIPLQSNGDVRWVLDESLKDIITTSPLPMDSVANCLQMIANAGCCVLYQDEEGVIHIEKLDYTPDDYIISQDNSYSKPETTLSSPIKDIKISVYSHEVSETEERVGWISPENGVSFIRGNTYTFEITHSAFITNARTGVLFIISTPSEYYTIDYFNTYGNYSEVKITTIKNYGNIKYGVYVNGYKVESFSEEVIIPVGTQGETITINNPLIATKEHAQMVADWVKNTLATRQIMTFNWRADPRLDALDVITSQDKKVIMTKVDYTYNGAFKGTGEGRVR